MRIYFSLDYNGYCYLNFKQQPLRMDTKVVDLTGLIECLELRAGIHHEEMSVQKRIAAYYAAFKSYDKCHPNHPLHNSFELDGLGTAQACLQWRDMLVMAGWNAESTMPIRRLEVLQGVESNFKAPSLGDRLWHIIKVVKDGCQLPPALEIIIPCELKLFPPEVKTLLDALTQRDVDVSIMPSMETDKENNLSVIRQLIVNGEKVKDELYPNDESLQIWKFADLRDAHNYLAMAEDTSADVWIDENHTALDLLMSANGKPTSGSVAHNVPSQVSQLLIIGLGLFARPLNISTLIDWLQVPLHPLPWDFRHELVKTIINTGGYHNDNCMDLIQQRMHSDNDFKAIFDKFMPSLDSSDASLAEIEGNKETMVDVQSIREYVDNLFSWAKKTITAQKNRPVLLDQLLTVVDQAESLRTLLNTEDKNEIPFNQVKEWMGSLSSSRPAVVSQAQKGCQAVVATPAQIIDTAQRTIWVDFQAKELSMPRYSFLSLNEKKQLAMHGIELWSEENELQYHQQMLKQAFTLTSDKLILVCCERDGNNPLSKHQFLVMMENTFKSLDSITKLPELPNDIYENCEKVDNVYKDATHIELTNPELIDWRQHESATSLKKLIQYPFDYAMEYLAKIKSSGIEELKDISRTQGLVAHAVIAQLFSPREGESSVGFKELKNRYDNEFASAFNKQILATGAILLMDENRVEAQILHEKLKESILVLIDVIQKNGLKVLTCEKELLEDIGLGHTNDGESGQTVPVLAKGVIDMILADDEGNNYIFDLKWTRSNSKHKKLLEENHSVQLALYKRMLEESMDGVAGVAYFAMPQNHLFSTLPFVGNHCKQVEIKENENADVFSQIVNSYKYRIGQISEGYIEMAEDLVIKPSQNGRGAANYQLPYFLDTENKGLLPLTLSNRQKASNLFSNYKFFKSQD